MDEWYYQLFEAEFGPVSFDELVDLAKNSRLSRDDLIRFGETGVWRRAGSIGPLMAHFPFEAVERVIAAEAKVEQIAEPHRFDEELSIDDFVISASAKALQTSHHFTPPQTESFESQSDCTSPTSKPASMRNRSSGDTASNQPVNEDESWWCLIEGREYGPVSRSKLNDWAATNRLHRNDHIRQGQQAYMVADQLPNLFPAIARQPLGISAASKETRPINRPLPSESTPPQTALNLTTSAPTPFAPSPARPEPGVTPVQSAPAAASTFSSPPAMPRPIVSPASFSRPMPPRPSSSGGFGNLLKSPVVLGIAGVIVIGGLIFGVMQILPFGDSTNIARVKELDGLVSEYVKLQKNETISSAAAKTIAEKMKKSASAIMTQLKDTKDRKSKKVLSAANKLDDLSKLDLSKPSEDQSKIDSSLSSLKTAVTGAKKALGI